MIFTCMLLGVGGVLAQDVARTGKNAVHTPFVVALNTQSPQQMFGVSYLQERLVNLDRIPAIRDVQNITGGEHVHVKVVRPAAAPEPKKEGFRIER